MLEDKNDNKQAESGPARKEKKKAWNEEWKKKWNKEI